MTPPNAEPGPGAPSGTQPVDADWQRDFLFRRRLEKARIPQRFAKKSFETYKATGRSAADKFRKELLQSARMYVDGFKIDFSDDTVAKGLLMNGQVGCGKSHLAVAILREVIRKGYTGLYYNSPDLLRDIRASFDRNAALTEDDLLEEVTTTDLLVFDDIGAERSSEFVLDRFYLIFNERYEACKPVIVTTNLEIDELEERLGKRIVSRMLEMCQSLGKFPEEDWRRKNLH